MGVGKGMSELACRGVIDCPLAPINLLFLERDEGTDDAVVLATVRGTEPQ
jgi:hypothetical protein